jgi:hypothetical protein
VTAIYRKPGAYEALLFVRGHGGKGIGRVPISVYELTSVSDQHLAEGQPLSLELLDSAAASIIKLEIASLPPGATLQQGTLHWIPTFTQAGTYTL